MGYTPRLKQKYKEEIVASLMKEYNYRTIMEVPRLEKISLNQGLGRLAIADKKVIDKGIEEMSLIAGQKAVATRSRKDISNFKLRKGMPIGVRVTLRGDKMYEFLDRLLSASIPRIRDFRGISDKGFDGRGNFSFGIWRDVHLVIVQFVAFCLCFPSAPIAFLYIIQQNDIKGKQLARTNPFL